MSLSVSRIILFATFALASWGAIASGASTENSTNGSTELVHRAIDLSNDGNYNSAIEVLTRAIAEDPRNAQAYFERAMALMSLDRDADAIADFSSALDISPFFPGALDWRARAFAAVGDFASAAEDCRLDLQPDLAGRHLSMGINPQKWADCAQLHVKAKRSDAAREMLETYFSDYSSRVTNYASYETSPMRVLASLYMETGESGLALQYARRAYSSSHRKPSDILVLALALEASGDLVGARKVCAEAMTVNDRMPGVQELHRRLEE